VSVGSAAMLSVASLVPAGLGSWGALMMPRSTPMSWRLASWACGRGWALVAAMKAKKRANGASVMSERLVSAMSCDV
jgi:hypothetical protein